MAARRLEIGPSQPTRTGWDTLDVVPGATWQARWGREPLPIPDETYAYVLASHVLEHVPWFETDVALREVCRILQPGGTFEVWVPDFSKIVNAYIKGAITDDGWFPLNPERDPWKSLNGRLFWGARRGEEGQEQHFHRACFDQSSLRGCLERAGFVDVQPAQRQPGEGHGWVEFGMLARK